MIAPNIEKHPLHKATWIAYDTQGFAFRVTGSRGNYTARPSYAAAAGDYRMFLASTLKEIASKVGASSPLIQET